MMSLFSLNSENRMDEIVNPLPTYDFTQLMCISPSSISGGNYFIRILKKPGQKPFYIQPPKCVTKQGNVKAGKKLVSDLLFKHEDESFKRPFFLPVFRCILVQPYQVLYTMSCRMSPLSSI